MADDPKYAARLEIDYPEQLDRLTTFFRLVWIIPIAIILGLISGAKEAYYGNHNNQERPNAARERKR